MGSGIGRSPATQSDMRLPHACRDLKARAAAIIEERVWHDVFHLWPLRSTSGRPGWLYHTWGRPWEVHGCVDDEGTRRGERLRAFTEGWASGAQSLQPDPQDVADALRSGGGPERKRSIRLW